MKTLPETLKCQKCGYEWYPIRPQLPKICPQCKKRTWNNLEGGGFAFDPNEPSTSYTIMDVEAEERASKVGYKIPPVGERYLLPIGRAAQIIIQAPRMGERLWFIIKRELEGGKYKGELIGTPLCEFGLQEGDIIEFEPRHIEKIGKGILG